MRNKMMFPILLVMLLVLVGSVDGAAWNTYLGGSSTDDGCGISIASSGNVLVTGHTQSSNLAGANNSFYGGSYDAFIVSVTSGGSLLWSTYIGGSSSDYGYAIVVDGLGNMLIAGHTLSSNLAGANNGFHGGSRDAFVAKVASGGSLVWSTYLGGSGDDYAFAIAVDSSDNIFVTGHTYSSNFAGAINSFHGGSHDAYIAKVTSSGTLVWARFLGGSSLDYGYGVTTDSSGNALIAGHTQSSNLTGAINSFHGGSSDGFAAKVTSSGTLLWASYLGGSGSDLGYGIALDSSGNPLVTGWTSSSNFEEANNSYYGGSRDCFVAKLISDGTPDWATYLGGSDIDDGRGIAVDSSDSALVTGYTHSHDFNDTNNSFHGATADGFAAKVTSSGTLVWASYLGGSGNDQARAIAVNSSDEPLITGETTSVDINNSNNSYYGGSHDAFVANIVESLPPEGVTVRGTVYDQVSNRPLPGVAVTADGKQTQTNSSGQYEIGDLSPGQITVTASRAGFEPNSTEVPGTTPGQTYNCDLKLVPDESDPDGDRLDNYHEMLRGTNPENPDTDDDGVLDGYEAAMGTDPTDRNCWFSNGLVIFEPDQDGVPNRNIEVAEGALNLLKETNRELDQRLNCVKFWLFWSLVEPCAVLDGDQLAMSEISEDMVEEYAFPDEHHPDYPHEFAGKVRWQKYDVFLEGLMSDPELKLAPLPWVGEGLAAPKFNGDWLNPDDSQENYLARLYLHVRGAVQRYGRPQQQNNWKAKDLIHFWNMENELNWTYTWRYTLLPLIDPGRRPQASWLVGEFTERVLHTIASAVDAEDPCAIRTHNFNAIPIVASDIVAFLEELTGISDLTPPEWAKGWSPITGWQDCVDVIGLGAYPNYVFSDPVLGYAVAPVVLTATELTGKPAMVVESGYPTGPYGVDDVSCPEYVTSEPLRSLLNTWLWTYTEAKQSEYITQSITLTRELGALPLAASGDRSGLGFIYFALNTEEAEGYFPCPMEMENYQGLMRLPNDPAGSYKEAFDAYKDALAGSSIIDATVQYISEGFAAVYSTLEEIVEQGTTTVTNVVVDIGRSIQNLLVNWSGSTLAVKLYKPDGSLYGVWESNEPPIRIDVGGAEVGTWTLEVTGVNIPDGNYPFVVVLETPLTLTSTIDIDPNTLNFKSRGRSVTAHLMLNGIAELNEEHIGWGLLSPAQDPNVTLHPEKWSLESPGDSTTAASITFKFSADEVRSWHTGSQDFATVLLRGGLRDGTRFEGSDTMRIIDHEVDDANDT